MSIAGRTFQLKKIKAWVLFYFTKTLGGCPSFED